MDTDESQIAQDIDSLRTYVRDRGSKVAYEAIRDAIVNRMDSDVPAGVLRLAAALAVDEYRDALLENSQDDRLKSAILELHSELSNVLGNQLEAISDRVAKDAIVDAASPSLSDAMGELGGVRSFGLWMSRGESVSPVLRMLFVSEAGTVLADVTNLLPNAISISADIAADCERMMRLYVRYQRAGFAAMQPEELRRLLRAVDSIELSARLMKASMRQVDTPDAESAL